MQVVAQLSVQDLPDDVRGLSMTARGALSEPLEVAIRVVSTDPGVPAKDWLCAQGSLSGRGTR